jgi:undecaprenyl-diphosphatase
MLAFDGDILLFIQEYLRCPALSSLLVPLTKLGNGGILWIAIVILLLFYPKTRKSGLITLLAMSICWIFNDLVLKNLIERPRPFTQIEELKILVSAPRTHSFPSGHSCVAVAVARAVWLTCNIRWIRIVVAILAGLMAFSRMYVGVHYPTDVLAGCFVGFLGSTLVWKLFYKPFDQLGQEKAEE